MKCTPISVSLREISSKFFCREIDPFTHLHKQSKMHTQNERFQRNVHKKFTYSLIRKYLSLHLFGQRVVKWTPISVGLREISSKSFLPKNQSLHSFAQGVSKWTPIFGLFCKISLIFFNPFTCLNWEEKNRGYF